MTFHPFPERELLKLADEYEQTAKVCGPKMREYYTAKAFMLTTAVSEHIALRERCLIAEMDRDQARRIAS